MDNKEEIIDHCDSCGNPVFTEPDYCLGEIAMFAVNENSKMCNCCETCRDFCGACS